MMRFYECNYLVRVNTDMNPKSMTDPMHKQPYFYHDAVSSKYAHLILTTTDHNGFEQSSHTALLT